MKGLSGCHIPNDKYREGWERIFGSKDMMDDLDDVLGRKEWCGTEYCNGATDEIQS